VEVLAHKKTYPTKDKGKQAGYDTDKKMILNKIQLIENSRIQERKYLEDIQGYVDRLNKKHNAGLLPEKVMKEEKKVEVTPNADTGKPGPQLGTNAIPSEKLGAEKEADKQDGEGQQTAKPVPEAPGGPGVEGGGSKAPF